MTTQNVSADVLRALHRIHRQLNDLRQRLERGPKQVLASQTLAATREEQLGAAKKDVKSMRVAADQKQLQLKASEAKIQDLGRKLNSASSNREYQALKDRIAAEKMADSVLDDEILEAWEKIELTQEKIREAEDALEQAKARALQVATEVDRQQPLIEGDITRLQAELTECEASLPVEAREYYNRVVRQKGEDSLAAVENEYCSGCHQHVPLNVCAEILLGKPTFCKTCGRLLYMLGDSMPGT